jgi:hypothetical protein
VPEGHFIVFVDGNRKNLALDNLANIPGKYLICLNRKPISDIKLRKAAIADLQRKTSNLHHGYIQVRDAKSGRKRKYRSAHTALWEAANGPVPEGHVIIFADGNRRNFALDNLLMVSKQQLFYLCRKRLFMKDIELTKSAAILAAVAVKTSELKKKIGKKQ